MRFDVLKIPLFEFKIAGWILDWFKKSESLKDITRWISIVVDSDDD